MSYIRVIPRDLFNEANLLKCYGQIYILLETAEMPHVELCHDGQPFDVQMDSSSGETYVSNVILTISGRAYDLRRPHNSRQPWPLEVVKMDSSTIQIFDNDGTFTLDMQMFMGSEYLSDVE